MLAEPSINGVEALKLDLETIPLQPKPFLTIEDFVTYNWADHSFTLTEAARKRLPEMGQMSVWGVPFIIVAGGKRVYLGAFWTSASSQSFEQPVIDLFGVPDVQPYRFARSYPRRDRGARNARSAGASGDPGGLREGGQAGKSPVD